VVRADSGRKASGTSRREQQDRVLTIPNGLSVARLAGVPVFLWLVLGPKADTWAVCQLVAAGVSDWLDGKIARAWNQQSRHGQVLDPAADRHYIAATLVGLAVRGFFPWWLVAVLLSREIVLGVSLLALRLH
jgi:cardiolipin synthase